MQTIVEFILEVIFDWTFSYPGAFIRWLVFRKKSLKDYLDDSNMLNAAVFVIFLMVLTGVVYLIEKI